MSTETTEALIASTGAPAGDTLPQTAAGAARSLARYVTGEASAPADGALSSAVALVRDAFSAGTYSPEDWNAALGLEPANPLGALVLRVLEDRASDNDVVLEGAKRLETVLKERHGAEGRGLHEYTTDVEDGLPEKLTRTLRWLATVRNNVVHGDGDAGIDGTHARARYALQAGRSYDWLANLETSVTGGPEFSGATSSGGKVDTLRKVNYGIIGALAVSCLVLWAIGMAKYIVVVALVAGFLAVPFMLAVEGTREQRQRQLEKSEKKKRFTKTTA